MPARKAASLCGLVNPVDVTPAFVIPIFQWEDGGDDLLVQVIDRDGRVENFITVEIGRYELNQEVEAVRLEVGAASALGISVGYRALACHEPPGFVRRTRELQRSR